VLADFEMITGDAVTLAVPPAPLGLRILAALIDILVLIGWQFVLYYTLGRILFDSSQALIAAAITVIEVFVLVGWVAGFETISGGRSPGKLICGTRVVRDDGGPITFRHALTRALIGSVELYTFSGVPAFLSAIFSRRHQRLGDRLAGTYVVRARTSWTASEPAAMPAHLHHWASRADLERVPAQEIIWCRQFLNRSGKLAPDARARAAHNLVLRIAPWILPEPPPATDEDILAAVLAERYRRELTRSEADVRLTARLLPDDVTTAG
jgi:uncharacterized RDD family membrane protein YckC